MRDVSIPGSDTIRTKKLHIAHSVRAHVVLVRDSRKRLIETNSNREEPVKPHATQTSTDRELYVNCLIINNSNENRFLTLQELKTSCITKENLYLGLVYV